MRENFSLVANVSSTAQSRDHLSTDRQQQTRHQKLGRPKWIIILLALLLSVWIYCWIHRLSTSRVVGTTPKYRHRARTSGVVGTTHSTGRTTASRHGVSSTQMQTQSPHAHQPLLWNVVGCDSKYPIVTCQEPGQTRKTYQLANFIRASRVDFDTHPILQRRWKSCAVVGSSGSLLLHEHGKEIDKHEIIARVNYPPVKGYEKHVGYRPGDIQFLGDKVSRCYNESSNKTLIVSQLPLGWRKRSTTISTCKRNANMDMFGMSQYVFNTAMDMVSTTSRKYGTSGFRAIVFCLLICDSVDAYGFGMDQRTTFHYFERGGASQGSLRSHNWNEELEIMKTWPNTTHPSQFGRLTWIP